MSSMPQHAVAKGMGQRLLRRDQLMTRLSCVVRKPSAEIADSMPMCDFLAVGRLFACGPDDSRAD